MTRPLEYAGEIASPEMQWEEFVEQSDVSAAEELPGMVELRLDMSQESQTRLVN
jgi:hypothetical protein